MDLNESSFLSQNEPKGILFPKSILTILCPLNRPLLHKQVDRAIEDHGCMYAVVHDSHKEHSRGQPGGLHSAVIVVWEATEPLDPWVISSYLSVCVITSADLGHPGCFRFLGSQPPQTHTH